MTAIPVHFAIDLEPDERMPRSADGRLESAGHALEAFFERRRALEDATGGPVNFGWYVRMDRHIEAVYGDARVIADKYARQLDDAAAAGDEVGIHIHSIERNEKTGDWRANYADAALVNDTIEAALAQFHSIFGQPCRASRMGDLWTNGACIAKLDEMGIHYDMTLECGLRPKGIAAVYPGTGSRGWRPGFFDIPSTPYRPDAANFRQPGGANQRNIWLLPLSAYRRTDIGNPGFWGVSLLSAVMSGLQQPIARNVFRPQFAYEPSVLPNRMEHYLRETAQPQFCVAIRNFGAAHDVGNFLDALCALARERTIKFVTPEDYVKLTRASAQYETSESAYANSLPTPGSRI